MSRSNLFILFVVILVVIGIVIFTRQTKDKESSSSKSKQSLTQTQVGDPKTISTDDHILGDSNAEIALIEYSDLECSYCKTFHFTLHQAVEDYKGKVKWVFRHFPLQFHKNAREEAEASECAAAVGGADSFWSYIDKIFDRTTSDGTGFAINKLTPLAQELGLNKNQFQICLDSNRYKNAVQTDLDTGKKVGVQGTPATLILNTKTGESKLLSGALPLDTLKAEIEKII